ncbi:hypothetical protein [Arthrobacter sp. NyZ413]
MDFEVDAKARTLAKPQNLELLAAALSPGRRKRNSLTLAKKDTP